jgi:hypothetical protein
VRETGETKHENKMWEENFGRKKDMRRKFRKIAL